jgi:uncharacterized protein YciI
MIISNCLNSNNSQDSLGLVFMFIIELSYKKALNDIDKHLEAHRAYLDDAYINNYFLVSRPKNPRTGGVIISQLNNRD